MLTIWQLEPIVVIGTLCMWPKPNQLILQAQTLRTLEDTARGCSLSGSLAVCCLAHSSCSAPPSCRPASYTPPPASGSLQSGEKPPPPTKQRSIRQVGPSDARQAPCLGIVCVLQQIQTCKFTVLCGICWQMAFTEQGALYFGSCQRKWGLPYRCRTVRCVKACASMCVWVAH